MQISHAALQFQHQHPDIAKSWHDHDNRLVFLQVDDEAALLDIKFQADTLNIPYSIFLEPDLNNSYTAIALAPVLESRAITKNLKLADFKKKTKTKF